MKRQSSARLEEEDMSVLWAQAGGSVVALSTPCHDGSETVG